MAAGHLRIGEFSDRVGVNAAVLRAWEKRYALLQPDRTEGGFRLYSEADVARVERMLRYLAEGAAAAEAARLAQQPEPATTVPSSLLIDQLATAAVRLRQRLEDFDEAGSAEVLDGALAAFALETVVGQVVLPCLGQIGDRWEAGDVSVAQEHFASNLLRGRLLGLARGWGQPAGPAALLATPPGEWHDLGLISFGLIASRCGMRVVFLGQSCPLDTLATTAGTVRPAAVVLSATEPGRFVNVRQPLRVLSRTQRLYIGGAGAAPALADDLGAEYLDGDVVAAAMRLATMAFAASR